MSLVAYAPTRSWEYLKSLPHVIAAIRNYGPSVWSTIGSLIGSGSSHKGAVKESIRRHTSIASARQGKQNYFTPDRGHRPIAWTLKTDSTATSGLRNTNVTGGYHLHNTAGAYHPQLGYATRTKFRQYCTTVTTAVATPDLFLGGGALTVNSIQLNPDLIGGRLAYQARTFQRYIFREIYFRFTPTIVNTIPGAMSLSYYSDTAASAYFTASYQSLQEENDTNIVVSLYNGAMSWTWGGPVPMGQNESYFCEADYATVASQRQTIQGAVLGYPSANNLNAALPVGNIEISGLIDFYCPTSDLGFALKRIKTQEEADYLAKCQKEYQSHHQTMSPTRSREPVTDEEEKEYIRLTTKKLEPTQTVSSSSSGSSRKTM